MIADVIFYWKMTSFMALDKTVQRRFYACKTLQIHVYRRMLHCLSIGGSSSVQWRKLEEAEDFKCVFVVYCVLESK